LFVDLHVDEHSPPGRRAHVRADRDTAERELEAAGFTLEQRLPDLDENYVSIFRAR
jgi:hypothetical protein